MNSPFGEQSESESSGDEMRMTPFAGFGRNLMNFPQTSIQMRSNFGGNGGTFKSTQMSYQTYVDKDGKTHVKKMEKTNNRHVDEHGNVMEDHEEFYKDSGRNLNKIKKKRRLNDRGMQITKENRNGEFNEYKQFYNMDEDDMGEFIDDWRTKGRELSRKNPQLRIQAEAERPLAIGYRPHRETRGAPTRKILKKHKNKPTEGNPRKDKYGRKYVKRSNC